jgi:hypothetical protein
VMRKQRVRTTCQNRGHPMPLSSERAMPDGVDALMNPL